MAPESERAKMVDSLEHTRSCPALTPLSDDDCTCGLYWRGLLRTEQEMHAAWRKRAEECELRELTPPATLTCSEVVERLRTEAHDDMSAESFGFVTDKATAILHSWRERRVQELEELLAKRSGCSHGIDSASGSTGANGSSETRKGGFEVKQLIEEARDCIHLYREKMIEFADIDALEWKANAAEKAMRSEETK